ncbi:hypothetical protein BDW_01590 [Bdellovibrio bacteriovorus W]|nr:hypothetical protein BDW_01590 [Bdellovibrio bacteriovorus W]
MEFAEYRMQISGAEVAFAGAWTARTAGTAAAMSPDGVPLERWGSAFYILQIPESSLI